jgi:hypothetical protein
MQLWLNNTNAGRPAVILSLGLSYFYSNFYIAGNLSVRGVDYIWPTAAPAAPATNKYLQCDSGGGLSWSTPPSGGGNVTGTGTPNYLTRWSNTTGGLVNSAAYDDGSIFQLQTQQLAVLRPDVYTGPVMCVYNQAQTVQQFTVTESGNLRVIRGLGYQWPSAQGTASQVLTVQSVTTGVATLQWQTPAVAGNVTGTGTINYLTKWNNTTGQLVNSAAYDDGSIFQLQIQQLAVLRPNTYSGPVLCVYDQTQTVQQFTVNQIGDLRVIRGLGYNWPGTQGTAGQVLTVQSVLSGVATLVWQTGGGGGANTFLSNLSESTPGTHSTSQVAINTWLLPATNADGTAANAINLGSPSLKFNAAYLYSGVFIYPAGSSTGSPRAFGWIPSPTAGSTTEASRFLVYGDRNSLQSGDQVRTQLGSYYGIELRGTRLSGTTAPGYATGGTSDPCVSIIPETANGQALYIGPAVTLANSLIEAWNGGTQCFLVAATGSTIIGTRLAANTPLTLNAPSGANGALAKYNVGGVLKHQINFAGSIWSEGGLRIKVMLIQPASGATIDLNNATYADCHTFILDAFNGNFTLLLPPLNATTDGTVYRFICNRRTTTNAVTVKSSGGADINETGVGGTTGWTLKGNAGNDTTAGYQKSARDAIVVGAYCGGSVNQWWISNAVV